MADEGTHDLTSKTVKIATTVIIHAGNARNLVNEALNEANEFLFESAREKLKQARVELKAAHREQTDVIQAEARGETLEITMLLTHAQDTLIVANSEVQMGKHTINVYEKLQECLGSESI
jgi:PTS system cellobiose-specific IIA component